MNVNSSIEWTDKTWNPVRGCSIVSPGCHSCYAMKQAHRFSGPGKAYEGLTKLAKAGPQWTGVVRTIESALLEPLSWRKPQRIFVNSMSDLFHEDVPDAFIDKVFAVMALCPQHTFQILTKRAERMQRYMTSRPASPTVPGEINIATEHGLGVYHVAWPLPNVWLGVSVENQHFADERIPLLLQTPAAVRFISAEPLLGPIVLKRRWLGQGADCDGCHVINVRVDEDGCCQSCGAYAMWHGIDLVIVGGESGSGARPCNLADVRSIVQQCAKAGVACFVKQLGSVPFDYVNPTLTYQGDLRVFRNSLPVMDAVKAREGRYVNTVALHEILNRKGGGDMSEWPADLRVRQFPEGTR